MYTIHKENFKQVFIQNPERPDMDGTEMTAYTYSIPVGGVDLLEILGPKSLI